MSCSANGSPDGATPQGNVMAGQPEMFANIVRQAWLTGTGSVKAKAVWGAVGEAIRSTCLKACLTAIPASAMRRCA